MWPALPLVLHYPCPADSLPKGFIVPNDVQEQYDGMIHCGWFMLRIQICGATSPGIQIYWLLQSFKLARGGRFFVSISDSRGPCGRDAVCCINSESASECLGFLPSVSHRPPLGRRAQYSLFCGSVPVLRPGFLLLNVFCFKIITPTLPPLSIP
jgi:hypothetical protein